MPNITIREYRDWILSHTNGNYTFKESEDQISLLTPYATGVIDFVEIMDYTIIQMQIIRSRNLIASRVKSTVRTKINIWLGLCWPLSQLR